MQMTTKTAIVRGNIFKFQKLRHEKRKHMIQRVVNICKARNLRSSKSDIAGGSEAPSTDPRL